jgi:hypothetical protein
MERRKEKEEQQARSTKKEVKLYKRQARPGTHAKQRPNPRRDAHAAQAVTTQLADTPTTRQKKKNTP